MSGEQPKYNPFQKSSTSLPCNSPPCAKLDNGESYRPLISQVLDELQIKQ